MLNDEQICFYREQGYCQASGIFSESELDEMEQAFDGIVKNRLAHRAKLDATWAGDWNKTAGTTIIHTHDVQAYDAVWSRAILHPRFTELLSDLIGPNVQLHHTKLFQKPTEKGSGFPVHQDYPYFPHEKHTMMAAVIHLSDATPDMGCLGVYPKSHLNGPMPTAKPKDSQPSAWYVDQQAWPLEKLTSISAKRGDILCFNYLTLHGSDINRSDHIRKTVLVQVRDPLDKPVKDTHRSNAQGLMLHGIDPLEQGRTYATGTFDEDIKLASAGRT